MAYKILIVDNHPEAIAPLPRWLHRTGYETDLATDIGQALALAETVRPDVILLDTQMPAISGIEASHHLQLNPATANIPVILMSSGTVAEAQAEMRAASADDYITHPIDRAELIQCIERLRLRGEVSTPDIHPMLEGLAHTMLAVLPCNMAWLLTLDDSNRWLVHRAIAVSSGVRATQSFLDALTHLDPNRDSKPRTSKQTKPLGRLEQLERDDPQPRLSLNRDANPLTESVRERSVLVNLTPAQFAALPGGDIFQTAFTSLGNVYINVLPMLAGQGAIGVLVFAAEDAAIAQSPHQQQLINAMTNQAAIAVENARLLADSARRERKRNAEQIFRQKVLDTMGEGLILVNESGRIAYVNDRLVAMCGHARASLYGHSVGRIFHEDDRSEILAYVSGVMETQPTGAQRLCNRDGHTIPVLLSRAEIESPHTDNRSTVLVVTDLTELHRREQALHRQTQRQSAINRAATAVSATSSFDEVVDITLSSALEIVEGVSASLMMPDAHISDQLVTVGAQGRNADQLRTDIVTIGEGVVGWVARQGQPQFIVDITQDFLQETSYDFAGDHERVGNGAFGSHTASYQHSMVVVPMLAADEIIGVLRVLDKVEGVFDQQDVEALEGLASATAIAIENARLFDQMRRRVTELSTLLDASDAVSSTLDFGHILERIAFRLTMALRVERVVIAAWIPPTNRMESLMEVVNAYWFPGTGPVRPHGELPISRAAFDSGELVRADLPDEIADGDAFPELAPSGVRTLVAFPIMAEGMPAGVLALQSDQPDDRLNAEQFNSISALIQRWHRRLDAGHTKPWWSRSELAELCRRILTGSSVRWCSVYAWDADQGVLRLIYEVGRALWLDKPGTTWDVNAHPSLAYVLEHHDVLTLHADDLDPDPEEQRYLENIGARTALIAPLLIRGEPAGLVKLIDSRDERRVFDDAELSLCQGIANVVGNAFENAQLYSAQEKRASALEAAYLALQEVDQSRDDLIQNLSHELRTPLTHVLGYLKLIEEGAFGALNEEQTDAFQVVVRKAQQMNSLVKDLIAVQSNAPQEMDRKPIHVERVVALAIRSRTGQAQRQGIRIVPHVPRHLPPIYADPVQIGGVFEELIDNAIKFSPNDTIIEVMLEDSSGPMLHACVRDQGIGLETEEHEKIFQRFYQVDGSTTRRFGGTGLGLAITRQVIEAHDGQIWIESTPGKGSCFHINLPKATQHTTQGEAQIEAQIEALKNAPEAADDR